MLDKQIELMKLKLTGLKRRIEELEQNNTPPSDKVLKKVYKEYQKTRAWFYDQGETAVSFLLQSDNGHRELVTQAYSILEQAYNHFNISLFGGYLPPCMITLQHKKGVKGFFLDRAFNSREGDEIIAQIAMNPASFNGCTDKEILSTLAHEMVHLEQARHGKPSRNGYHNQQWADWMLRIGLHPSDTGKEGGKQTGQRMTHYIIKGGAFDKEAKEFLKIHTLKWESPPRVVGRTNKKSRYVCLACDTKAWGKSGLNLMCGDCKLTMIQY